MFVCKHDKLLVQHFYVFSVFFVLFIAEILLNLIRDENGMEIQAVIQPGKLFIFQNICVLFFLHDLHDQCASCCTTATD